MEQAHGHDSQGGRLLEDFGTTAIRSPETAARRIGEVMVSAAGKDPTHPAVARSDAAVISALRAVREADPVLELVPLETLTTLAGRCAARLKEDEEPPSELRRSAWDLLDLLRRPSVLRRIPDDERNAWASRILALVERSHLTVGPLFRSRADLYGSKPLFQADTPTGPRVFSWRQTAARVETVARGLLSLGEIPAPVAVLSENRFEAIWLDLACLTSGLVNVPIPANATETDVGFILNHCKAGTVVASTAEQLDKVLRNREGVPTLENVVVMDPAAAGRGVTTLDAVSARAGRVPVEEVERRSLAVRSGDLATIMYTSGTTGVPKGIQFSHENIVFKRFCRALALPEIGEQDVFLCYLPLYHTFGRFLEMLGCIFWGSTYSFLDGHSSEALVAGMQRWRPTVFISVPRKWIQLYEAVRREADPETVTDAEALEATRRITGGRLRWGLSAAGYLDPEIFRFFQRQGTELMSGFGMTEATGGITMTPPGRYKDDSLGPPLPGIEARQADDGELLVRGPYVMMGYLDPEAGEAGFDDDGWLHSGDLMETDSDGHFYLVDRKKEIYKNVKGETIAPQRIENLFRDFESVGFVFLVGDHKEYNTALIYPNPDYSGLDFGALDTEEVKDHFRSVVVSVNTFLAPYERVVDFALIDRNLDPERGELTAKGTPRRRTVQENFAEVIRSLYRRTSLEVGGVKLSLPNWLFQRLGLTAQDIRAGQDRILLHNTGASLEVKREDECDVRIGTSLYRYRSGLLSLGSILTSPRLWLGNHELVEFVPLDLGARDRPRGGEEIVWVGQREAALPAEDIEKLRDALRHSEHDLMDLHLAARAIHAPEGDTADLGLRLLEIALGEQENVLAETARLVLARAASHPVQDTRRRAFQILGQAEKDARFADTLEAFLSAPGLLLDDETRAILAERDLSEVKLDACMEAVRRLERSETWSDEAERRVRSLLRFLADYGAAHPIRYRSLRAFVVRTQTFSERDGVREEASRSITSLRDGFRRWLGPTQRIAVDPETGHEYRWSDVVTFDQAVPEDDRRRILSAIRETTFLREAVFLFSEGAAIRLQDIPPGGVWVRLLGSRHGKSVYRITVQSRHQGSYDVACNVNHGLSAEQVQEEIRWLILCGDPSGERDPLVEDFGGYLQEQDLWSEEFIAGETLDRALRRLSRRAGEQERFRQVWPFFAWSAMSAYVDFWNRTGRTQVISDPGTKNVIVPTYDYLTGARLVSVSSRNSFEGLVPMLDSFRERLVRPVEEEYPELREVVGWDAVFSSLLEVVGEDEGIEMLREALRRPDGRKDFQDALERYVSGVVGRGFLPMRLYFAARRYRRWASLSREPTPQARARTMQELYDDYGLQRLSATYPEIRVRFFRETVFHDASEPLAEALDEIIARLRRGELVGDELVDAVADLRIRLGLSPDDDYFLARLSLPYLRPEDAAGFVEADRGGRHQSEIVVTLEDQDGGSFFVRHALNPKEVGRLHRLFLAANLDIRFRPEHRYLVAVNDRLQIIGGIYYDVEQDGKTAHLEKIVVAERYRRRGVATGLMNEFFNRLRASGAETVTTGFYRPEYFYGYGFSIEKRYAGLVKNLAEPEAREPVPPRV